MTDQSVRGALLEVIAEILPHVPASEVLDHRTLDDLGADSVDRVEIVTAVVDRLGDPRPLTEFADVPRIGELIARLGERGVR